LARLDALTPIPQPTEGVTYAAKISKAEAQLEWNESAEILARKIRAFNPFPGATFNLEGEPVKVWRAEVLGDASSVEYKPGQLLTADSNVIDVACGQGVLLLLELQSPGGRRVTSTNWLNAKRLRHH
jgi:methionyl-tRNA formyltransferase